MKYWKKGKVHCIFCGRLTYEKKLTDLKTVEKIIREDEDFEWTAMFFCNHCKKGFGVNYNESSLFKKYEDDAELINYLKLRDEHESVFDELGD